MISDPRHDEDEPLLSEGDPRWSAGWVAGCNSRSPRPHAHAVTAVHVTVRCVCGAAFQSTDASIAYGMAFAHGAQREAQP